MLSLLFYHLIISLYCALTGVLFYSLTKTQGKRPVIYYPITGLITITLATQIAALFTPVNQIVFLSITALLLFGLLSKRNYIHQAYQTFASELKQLPAISLFLIFSVWFVVLVFNAGPTLMDDTESYHIQMIKWLKEYGTVPGIANLHERFGFNSSWFSTISFFLPFRSAFNFYTALNGLLSVWMATYLIGQFSKEIHQKHSLSSTSLGTFAVFTLAVMCWPMLRGNAATTNYDFITILLIVILFMESIKTRQHSFTSEWFLWPAFLFTVRIVNFPMLLLSLASMCAMLQQKQGRRLLLLLLLSALFVLPFVARNVGLSGYPFYPAKAFNIFDVDWKVNSRTVNNLVEFIKYFNRVNTMFQSISTTKQIPFPNWIGAWFHYLFTYDKLVLLPGLAGFGSLLFALRKRYNYNRATWLFSVVLLMQLITWFFIAPDPRFVYGPLLCGCYFLIANLVSHKAYIISPKIFFSIALLLSLSFFSYGIFKIVRDKNHQGFFVPQTLPQPPLKQVTIGTVIVNIPEKILNNWNPRCFATDLPCLYEVNPKLRLRGQDLKDGFRLEK